MAYFKNCPFISIILLCCCLVIIDTNEVKAQHCKFFEIKYKDSLEADNETNVLMNNIKIKNPNGKVVRLAITILMPTDWKSLSKDPLLSGKEIFYTMAPHTEKNISLNLLKTPRTIAKWDSVFIKIRVPDVTDTHYYSYHLRAKPNPRFTAQYITEDMELADRPEGVPLSVRIKNTGNIEDTLTLHWQNQYLGLDEKKKLFLLPGEDTFYTYILRIPSALWGGFYREEISLIVKGSGISTYAHPFKLVKPRHVVKDCKSPYTLLPLQLEGGMINQNSLYNYYVGARGDIQIADHNDLHFYYKSKQFGNEVYGIQQNMYLVDYHYYNWRAAVGMIQPNQKYFMSNGRGFSLSHAWDENTDVTIAGILRDPNFYYTSNNFSAQARYKIGDYKISQVLATNFDQTNYLNGYVLANNMELIDKGNMNLSVLGGVGLEQKTRNVPGVKKELWGLTSGYRFSYHDDDWNITSNIEYCSNDFPGINKGMRIQMHQLTHNFNKAFAGIFYSSNYLNSSYFRDTLYNTDILKYNTERIGTNFGVKDKGHDLLFNTGMLNETGAGNIYDLNHLLFFDINYSWQPRKNMSFILNSQNAYKGHVGVGNDNVFITSSMASINVGWPGVLATYTRRPIFASEGTGNRVSDYDETVSAGPFMKFHFFRNQLSGMIKYQLSKSAYDQVIRAAIGGGLSYNNEKIGTSLQVSANIPTTPIITNGHQLPVSEDKFLTVTLMKQLNVPVITHRKYYTLKMVLYDDANNNGRKDDSEKALDKMKIDINHNETLITNRKGMAEYVNIEKGSYALEFKPLQARGLVPVNGLIQSVNVDGNTTIDVPYKKGRLIKGNIHIIRDTFSTTVFTADEIKVIATDTGGRSYTTVTDGAGNFFFNLPAGMYTISLNKEAFEGSDFKPERVSFPADLLSKEQEEIFFVIKQKPRKVHFLEMNKKNNQN